MTPQVTLEEVLEVSPIENADKLEMLTVLGYKTIAGKGQFKPGDACVFHHPDTVVDHTNPCYSFLNSPRIKTVKLRGQYSTGLALPVSVLPEPLEGVEFGHDLTEIMKATKYTKNLPAVLKGAAKGDFPAFLIKTDELNLRSHPYLFEELQEKTKEVGVYITGKMDGQSITYFVKDGEPGCCSRNLELKNDETTVAGALAKRLGIFEALKATGKNLAVQGELLGPGIQGNRHKLPDVTFRMFNLFDIDSRTYLGLSAMILMSKHIPMVDTIYNGPTPTMEELINKANETNYEGLVVRPNGQQMDSERTRRMLSGKVLSEKWAAKHGE